MKTFPSEISLRQASIFELRTLARNMGVNSPTIYKKEDLINKMMKIANGEEKPEIPKSRAGRPPKHIINKSFNGVNDASTFFCEENKDLNDSLLNKYDFTEISQQKQISILASPEKYAYESELANTSFDFETRTGYIQELENKSYFIFEYGKVASVENAVSISQQDVEQFCLRKGDMVKVLCKKDGINGNRFFAKLEEFENQKFTNKSHMANRPCFDDMQIDLEKSSEPIFEETGIDNDSMPCLNQISFGSRNILLCKNLRRYMDIVCKFKNINKPCSVINICLEVLPEEEGIAKNGANYELFHTCYGDFEKQNNHTISLAIDRIKRLTELGKDVIVLVNEVGKIIKFKNFALGNDAQDLKYKSFDNVSKLMTLARKLKNGNSVTVLALLKEESSNPNFSRISSELDNLNCNIYTI